MESLFHSGGRATTLHLRTALIQTTNCFMWWYQIHWIKLPISVWSASIGTYAHARSFTTLSLEVACRRQEITQTFHGKCEGRTSFSNNMNVLEHHGPRWCCWWLKSCTTWDVRNLCDSLLVLQQNILRVTELSWNFTKETAPKNTGKIYSAMFGEWICEMNKGPNHSMSTNLE